jgi:large subunit ribosomal protein L32
MPPLPKRRRSQSRQGTHNAHNALKLKSLSVCSHCHKPVLPHHVCPYCGYYNGQDVLQIEGVDV